MGKGGPLLHLFDGFIPEFIRWLSLATTILLLFFSFVTSQEGAKSVLSLYIFFKFEYKKKYKLARRGFILLCRGLTPLTSIALRNNEFE